VALPADEGWDGDLGRFDVAYAAFNDFAHVEWIRQRPLPLGAGVVVHHFHAIDAMPAENSLWAVRD